MIIFVNNKSIEIFEKSSSKPKFKTVYDYEFDLETEKIEYQKLKGSVLFENASFEAILQFIHYLQSNKMESLTHICFEVLDKKNIKKTLKKSIPVIKACGGIVKNKKGKVLLMKRLGFWDLPKGKAEANETSIQTACREVEEECNITVKAKEKICSTWHTYLIKGKLVIKQTKWYDMELISDKKMKPQLEEGIEKLKWMNDAEVIKAMSNSYASIAFVIKKYGIGLKTNQI